MDCPLNRMQAWVCPQKNRQHGVCPRLSISTSHAQTVVIQRFVIAAADTDLLTDWHALPSHQ